jgi:hypothetical protein
MKRATRDRIFLIGAISLFLPSCGEKPIFPTQQIESGKSDSARTDAAETQADLIARAEALPLIDAAGQRFFARDMFDPEIVEKIDTVFDRADHRVSLNRLPAREPGEDLSGAFTEVGFAVAFKDLCGFEMPDYVRPAISDVSSITSRPQYSIGLRVRCDPARVEELVDRIEASWRDSYPIEDRVHAYQIKPGDYSRMQPTTDSYGIVWPPTTRVLRMTHFLPEGSDSDHTFKKSVRWDPDSGWMVIGHWEGYNH